MKLVTFEIGGARHVGAFLAETNEIVDFTTASDAAYFRDMLALSRFGVKDSFWSKAVAQGVLRGDSRTADRDDLAVSATIAMEGEQPAAQAP